MSDDDLILIYLDTNVYARPFDDQTLPNIQGQANAFLAIISQVRANKLTLLCSDILAFEVQNILSEEKRKVEDYLSLCAKHVANSEEVLELGKHRAAVRSGRVMLCTSLRPFWGERGTFYRVTNR